MILMTSNPDLSDPDLRPPSLIEGWKTWFSFQGSTLTEVECKYMQWEITCQAVSDFGPTQCLSTVHCKHFGLIKVNQG